MQSIREDIEKEHHAIQKSDVFVFFQVVQFVTSFQYHKFSTSKVKNLNIHIQVYLVFPFLIFLIFFYCLIFYNIIILNYSSVDLGGFFLCFYFILFYVVFWT